VQWKTETQLQAEYADVLGAEADTALLRVAQDLDAGLHATEPPAVLWSVPWRLPEAAGTREGPPGGWMPQADQDRPLLPPPALAAGKPLGSDPSVSGGNRKWRMHTKLYAAFTLVAACAVLLATGVSMAGPNTGSIAYLGPPASVVSTASERPLDGFHRVNTFVRRGRKPELIFLAAQVPGAKTISIERWPLVKALSQFGRLTGINAVDKHCVPVASGPTAGLEICTIPTYDLSHARYSSPYLAFDSKDLVRTVGSRDRAFQPLSPIENVLFDRYVRYRSKPKCLKLDKSGNPILVNGQFLSYTCTSFGDYIDAAIFNQTDRVLPLIAVGDYLQTVSQIMITGDFVESIPLTPTPGSKGATEGERVSSFDADRNAMLTGRAPFLLSGLVRNVNSEANVITALICHATKNQPKSVCSRPTIKLILKSVK